MIKVPYQAVKREIQTGDMAAWRGFGGNPIEFVFSLGIMAFTKSPVTHISTAIVTKINGRKTVLLAEAMAAGFMLDSLDRRLAMHTERRWKQCWWLPLSKERRAKLDEEKLTDYLLRKVECGVKYDALQAIKSAFSFTKNKSCDKKLFCSESHIFALLAGGAIRAMNPSEVTPMDVIRFNIHDDCYQIHGKKMGLKGINTVEPEGWNE